MCRTSRFTGLGTLSGELCDRSDRYALRLSSPMEPSAVASDRKLRYAPLCGPSAILAAHPADVIGTMVQCHNIVYSYSITSFTLSGMNFFQLQGGEHAVEGDNDAGAKTGVH